MTAIVPNAETIEAMKAAQRGELITAGKSSGALLARLNEDDDRDESGPTPRLAITNEKRSAPSD